MRPNATAHTSTIIALNAVVDSQALPGMISNPLVLPRYQEKASGAGHTKNSCTSVRSEAAYQNVESEGKSSLSRRVFLDYKHHNEKHQADVVTRGYNKLNLDADADADADADKRREKVASVLQTLDSVTDGRGKLVHHCLWSDRLAAGWVGGASVSDHTPGNSDLKIESSQIATVAEETDNDNFSDCTEELELMKSFEELIQENEIESSGASSEVLDDVKRSVIEPSDNIECTKAGATID